VEQGRWSGVLVTEIERLARGDTIDQGIVAQTFKAGNTKIITPAKTYDPNDEFDEEYFEFGLFMSRREYKTINRRIQRGRLTSVKEGKFISSVPPYGYNKAKLPDDKGYSLVINEAEANVVQLIYDLYIKGRGMAAIAGELDKWYKNQDIEIHGQSQLYPISLKILSISVKFAGHIVRRRNQMQTVKLQRRER
jgi:DNA invertase Pin-like site-specific DNA recombinase